MKLTIRVLNPNCFQIVEQETGRDGWIDESLYEDSEFAIFQRRYPEYRKQDIDGATCMDTVKNLLYIGGQSKELNEKIVICDGDLRYIIMKLDKVFKDFKVIYPEKFVLLKGD